MKEITINGKPVPIHFGIGAIREFEQLGKGDEQNFETILNGKLDGSVETLIDITTIGLNHGARLSKIDKRYMTEDVELLIDENPEIIEPVMEIFSQSIETLMDRLGNIAGSGNSNRPKTARPRAVKPKK